MIYKNALITTINEQFLGWIELDADKKITSINKGQTTRDGIDCKQNIIMPGFIDSHTHGGYGLSFDDLSNEKLYVNYLENLKKEGVVAFAGTNVTSTIEKFTNDIPTIKKYLNDSHSSLPKLVSWYYEGPFISKAKKGAHEEKLIIPIDGNFLETLKKELTPSLPIIITVDAENKENQQLIKKYQNDFIFALGHTNSNYEDSKFVLNNGAKRITHLYNAMSGFHHSTNMGVLNVIFNHEFKPSLNIELISDGVHVSNEVIKYTYENLPIDNISIISDSLSAKGLNDGDYKLGNLEIEKKGNWFYLKNSTTLSGSATPFVWLVKNFKQVTNCSWTELVKVSSYNTARNLGLAKNYGGFVIGEKANFVLVDKDLNLLETFI